ncbi:hypothetical protein [Tellurirhabdus rosea]|uniref:hypothetical protein n=1 Tax=Tellurirhabdus rosea TaxID=2674997 RepID=UPI00225A7845|nr:hypothetical protein [Tellurirhabdus rosea]
MKYGLFTICLCFLLTTPLFAQQSDTLRTTVTQEECRLTSEEINRFICYVTRANVEEKTLIKFGLSPLFREPPLLR